MKTYNINGRDIPLFPAKYLYRPLGLNYHQFNKRIVRGLFPPPSFKTPLGRGLYPVEEIGLYEYISKEMFTKGRNFPGWLIELYKDAAMLARKVVWEKGGTTGPEDWEFLEKKYRSFDKERAQTYIEYWQKVLLDNIKVFREVIKEDWEDINE